MPCRVSSVECEVFRIGEEGRSEESEGGAALLVPQKAFKDADGEDGGFGKQAVDE
jgi:hypothetical protein